MIYVVTGIFAIWLLYSHINKQWVLGRLLIALLLLVLVFGCILYHDSPASYSVDFLSSFVFCTAWWFFIKPYLGKTPKICSEMNPSFDYYLTRIVFAISFILLVCEIIDIPYFIQAVTENALDLRKAMAEGEGLINIPNRSIYAYAHKIISLLYPLSYIFILLFFYYITFIEKRLLLKICLLFASLASVYYGTFSGGRTNLIYWVLSFIACSLLFWPYLKEQRRKLRGIYTSFAILFVFFVIYFVNTTVGRFGESSLGTEGSLLSYAGQQFLQFNDFFQNYPPGHFSLRRIFPFISQLLVGEMSLTEYRAIIYHHCHMDIGIFYTLLGDLLVDIGVIGMYLYAIIYNTVARKSTTKEAMNIADLLILMVLFLIPLQGLFYYSYWRPQVTVCMISVILIANYLKRKNYV